MLWERVCINFTGESQEKPPERIGLSCKQIAIYTVILPYIQGVPGKPWAILSPHSYVSIFKESSYHWGL